MNSEKINLQEQTHFGAEHQVDSLQSTESMMAANQSLQLAIEPTKGYKSTWVIILVISLVLCLGVVIALIFFNMQTDGTGKDNDNISVVDDDDSGDEDEGELIPYDSLTKDDALNFLRKKYSKAKIKRLPKGFLPEGLTFENDEAALWLFPSYDELDKNWPMLFGEVSQTTTFGFLMDDYKQDDFILDTVSSRYWTSITLDSAKTICKNTKSTTKCWKGVAFDKKYLDYYDELPGVSEHYVLEFKDFSQDFVEMALPVVFAAGIKSEGADYISGIYSYFIEEIEDKYILTAHCISVLPRFRYSNYVDEGDDAAVLVISLYDTRFELDKNTGEVSYQIYDDNSKRDVNKLFGISVEESEELERLLAQWR